MRAPFRRWAFLAAAAGLFALASTEARAITIGEVLEKFGSAQNSMITAASQYQSGDAIGATATLQAALATLDSIRDDVVDPAVADKLGNRIKAYLKKIGAAEKKITKAQVQVQGGKKAKAVLNKLKVAAKGIGKPASLLGKPVLGEINAKTAGFHKPGEVVQFQIYAADGTPCTEPPVVTVENQPLSDAVDLDSVFVEETTGVITLTMGQDAGGGQVSVTACGQTATVLVYNYGPKTVSGLPEGFPANLPGGTYRLSYSATICGTLIGCTPIPETVLGTYPLGGNLKDFAKTLQSAFNAAVAAATQPGCSQSVAYSAFNDNFFTVTYTVTCTSGEATATSTLVFKLTRI